MSAYFPLKYFAVVIVFLSLAACGNSSGSGGDSGGSSSSSSSNSSSSSSTSSSSTSSSSSSSSSSGSSSGGLGLLSAGTSNWLDAQGNPIALKGVNLGNWLLLEFWMMAQTQVVDQCSLESTLDNRFGFEERERLMKVFRDNWITERDWDEMQRFGFNLIRLPFIWNLIEDENNPKTLRDDAWQYLDYALAEAEKRNMYVILDMHGVVGSQGVEHHSGCADKNLYWTTPEYQDRTRWLWQQVATRYKDRNVVAGYGLLNEPWGTTAQNLASDVKALYDVVREIDSKHVIVLPGHNSGIWAYGNPADNGMTNVAFEMHFYPGFFGWDEIGYTVHRDWLLCGADGVSGVCEWDTRLKAVNTPFLVGEFQPWSGLGYSLGARISRKTYDTYNGLGWAATAWSYKILSTNGGQGRGTWGAVTNARGMGLLAGASTWSCTYWNAELNAACGYPARYFTVPGEGAKDYYLVIKAGSLSSGSLDVSFDELAFIQDGAMQNLLTNGSFGSKTGWTEWNVSNTAQTRNYNATAADYMPIAASAGYLRLSGSAGVNGGIYQKLTLQGGSRYLLSGSFKDNGSASAWAEIYLVQEEPENGRDVVSKTVPDINFALDDKSDIEAFFTSLSSMPYEVHADLQHALTTTENDALFTLPAPPSQVTLSQMDNTLRLQWAANSESDVTGYRVYRSDTQGGTYTLISEVNTTSFEEAAGTGTYYYVITALDSDDESFYSQEVFVE